MLKISKGHFFQNFRHYETVKNSHFLFFEIFSKDSPFFSKNFQGLQKVHPSLCLISCNRTNVEKSQRVLFKFFGTMWSDWSFGFLERMHITIWQLSKTRRERPKSAPYLRLKNIQGTTIGKIRKKFFFKKKKFWFFFRKKVFFRSHNAENSKRGHSGSFNVFYKPTDGRWTNMKDEQKL